MERTSRLPACPDCGLQLPYARIDLANPFECPSCGEKLCVPVEYKEKIRRFCFTLAIVLPLIFALVWHNIFLLIWMPVIGFLLAIIAPIFWKRIFPPEIVGFASETSKARYQAL